MKLFTLTRFVALAVALPWLAGAQTAETRILRAVLSPANEVPALTLNASGAATVNVHVIRDTAGRIVSGSVDFEISYAFPGAVNITGLHIHRGAAGVNGPVIIDSGITAAAPVTVNANGRGTLSRQAQVREDNANGLETLNALFANPETHYVNLHTVDNPGGAVRGQVQRPPTTGMISVMTPANEVPAITGLNATASSIAVVKYTQDAAGNITSGEAVFDITYDFPAGVTFTGFHIHRGRAGVNGPVTINSGLTQQVSAATGKGFMTFRVEVAPTNAEGIRTILDIFNNSDEYYLNLHTTEHPGGAVRGQLRPTDVLVLPVRLSPANEVPAVTGLDATGVGELRFRTLRAPDGRIEAAHLRFDVNYRFPGAVEFTGLHIHEAAAGANGPVRIDSGIVAANSVNSATGFGNIFERVTFADEAGLAAINGFVANPERYYLNLHTRVHPGGAVRGQLGTASTPAVTGVLSASLDRAATTVAPGGLFTVFGTNLARVSGGLGGWQGPRVPDSLNGVRVTVGGRPAPLLFTGPGQINAQVPVDVASGSQPVVVTTGGAASPAASVDVAAVAPALFIANGSAIAVKHPELALVTAANPAAAGDVLILYVTGLGQTRPALETGVPVAAAPLSEPAPVTVTVGGQNATVIGAAAAPGFLGLYQVAVTMPAGVSAGPANVVLRMGNVSSVPAAVMTR